MNIYIYIYGSPGRQPGHDFQIWSPQPFALGCAGWSPVLACGTASERPPGYSKKSS